MICTNDGVKAVRTIKRKPAQDRWNLELLNSFCGLPWNYRAGTKTDSSDIVEFLPAHQPIDAHQGVDPSAMGGPEGDVFSRTLRFSVPT